MTIDQIIANIQVSSEDTQKSKEVSEMLASIESSNLVMILADEGSKA